MRKSDLDALTPGVAEPLEKLIFHSAAPFTRRRMAGGQLHPDAHLHIAVHEISDLGFAERQYCAPHRHNCAEINLLLSLSNLVFRITLNAEVYEVAAPASIYIPPGVIHSANVLEGTGFFVAILETLDYHSSVLTD
jgi:quercetin dioxygenase-like cupin family protein